jgi:hypothetical protein
VRNSTSSRAKAVTGFTSPRRSSLLQAIAHQPIGMGGLRVVLDSQGSSGIGVIWFIVVCSTWCDDAGLVAVRAWFTRRARAEPPRQLRFLYASHAEE